MPEKIIEVLNKLTEAKGAAFTEGLIAGISIGTRSSATEDQKSA